MTRTYGNEKTHLTLTNKAFAIYSESDPLDIIEHEDEDGNLTYDVRGIDYIDSLSEEEVNDYLERLYDEAFV